MFTTNIELKFGAKNQGREIQYEHADLLLRISAWIGALILYL